MSELTFVEACNAALRQELDRDDSVFVMGEDIAHFGGMFRVTEGLLDAYGERRIVDTPISESGFLGMALGAALAGQRPVAELMFIDFSLVAMDQLLNQIAKTFAMSGGTTKVPLTIITQGGGYKGAAAQHSQMLEALCLHVPGLKVVTASHPSDAKGLLASCIRDDNPTLFLEHKQLFGMKGEVPDGEHTVPLGKAHVVREGNSLSLFTYSYTVQLAYQATEGMDVEIVDLRTLNPLDWEAVAKSVTKTNRALVVHESHRRCGVGVDLAHQIQDKLFDELDGPVKVHAAMDLPIPFAVNLENLVLPTVESIRAAVIEAMNG